MSDSDSRSINRNKKKPNGKGKGQKGNQSSSESQDISFDQEQFDRLYTKQLRKKQEVQIAKKKAAQAQAQLQKQKQNQQIYQKCDEEKEEGVLCKKQRKNSNLDQSQYSQIQVQQPRQPSWYIYSQCQSLVLDRARFSSYILQLPIFKKKQQILTSIINNQVMLVTGQTGCGKSTQVPRLLYEYIRETKLNAKIICVQPRRLAVKNLHKLLGDQIPEKDAVGYHIAMQTRFTQNTKILFMTNGIFLQRLVHGTQFFNEYPFIVLDQVHQRDIDTDFVLLSMKRLMRRHPKLRVILMSATIDNKLFQYYFAQDQVDNFMQRENFYKKYIRLQQEAGRLNQEQQDQQAGFRIQRINDDQQLYKKIQMQYLHSKFPGPTVNVTEKGKFKKDYFYLDSLGKFFKRNYCMKWGSVGFIQKSPSTNKQLYEAACVILDQIMANSPKDRSNESTLIFLPGLGQIQTLALQMALFFTNRINNFQIVKCHSTILNDEITKKLHGVYKDKFKVIIATNIAQSSITVFGIKYIIDFCLTKQINFNQKSRMENLQLVWASKASCQQRAGRTGRVCDGIVFKLVQKAFYDKLQDYSTPQIQRSSLDKLILRIKLIHQNEKQDVIFQDPGQVLGTAIQPPNLKHIDQSIKSLIICGGLSVQNDKLNLTKLGRIYVDIPLDIIYSKMLVFSMLMGTYEDILILVCILSQNKNAFKKSAVERYPLQFMEIMSNQQRCDFLSLINAYKNKEAQYMKNHKSHAGIEIDIHYQTKQLIQDVSRRIKRKKFIKKIYESQNSQNYEQKFKITIAFGFLSQLIKVRPMIYDDKQQKRNKLMKKQGITVRNTVVLLNSDIIRKSSDGNQSADNRLRQNWIQNIANCFRIKPQNITMTLGHGISFLHFKNQTDLNKFLFVKFMQKKKGITQERSSNNRTLTLSQILPHLGDIDYMQQGNPVQIFKQQRVVVDTFSSNRVVAVNKQNQSFQFPSYRLLITNSITQHNSRLSCRYSSLLPQIPNLQIILHLIFYPFVVLLPDKKRTKYDSLYLKKRTKLYINYQLQDEQIHKANKIRMIIKQLMDLSLFLESQVNFDVIQPVLVTQQGRVIQIDDQQQIQSNKKQTRPNIPLGLQKQNKKIDKQRQKNGNKIQRGNSRQQKMKNFWPMVKQFILMERKPVVQQQKWQQIYFNQMKITQNFNNLKYERQQQRDYMNQIKTFDLRFSYFSSNSNINHNSNTQNSRENRIKQYQAWKLTKYKAVVDLQALATDHDPYIVCQACGIKIAKLNKVGPINSQYFRQLFDYIEQNVMKLPYNELGDYFCSMLMTIYIQKQYQVYGCKNGHYLALKFKQQKKLKILTFSAINVLYTDGTVEQQPQFQSLQYKIWRQKFETSKNNKMKKNYQTSCFVCGDKFKNIKQVQLHVKNSYHEANLRDFKSTISSVKEVQAIDKLKLTSGVANS